jgi:uncharacterized cofD-like protein
MKVVSFGGGHGLSVTLEAEHKLTKDITAIVSVGDDGGSSGRLRQEFDGTLPPGDLRMALCALASDRAQELGVPELLQHRFESSGATDGHALGNYILEAVWQRSSILDGIESLQTMFGIDGRVLPCASVPLTMKASVVDESLGALHITGQRNITQTRGHIESIAVEPAQPPTFPQVVEAILDADVITFGPGSWYTSVLVHFLVPQVLQALRQASAKKVLITNLCTDSEVADHSIKSQIESFKRVSESLPVDAIIMDASPEATVIASDYEPSTLCLTARLKAEKSCTQYDVELLSAALKQVFSQLANSTICQ